VLVIAGQRTVRREARSDEARHVIERSCASFFGRFCLPEDAAVGQVRAAMDDGGELVVTVPRIGAAAVLALPEPALAIQVEASPC
jgi:HSP20 family protein